MNIQLKTVLRDLTGASGMKVIEAIVNGERDPNALEKLVGKNVKASREDIRNALNGDWRSEHLFELKQNYSFYQFTWEKIRETDKQIEALLIEWEKTNGDVKKRDEYTKMKHKKPGKNPPGFNVNRFAYQMTNGVDLTQIEGVNVGTILTMMTETGFNLKSKFKTAKHFASWLGYSPNRKITGGKTISSHTEKIQQPLSYAIRQSANAVGQSQGRLGDFFRKIAYRKGRKIAITATARKIAVIIYKMLESGEAYNYEYSVNENARHKKILLSKTIKTIKKHNFTINEFKVAFV